MSHRVSLGTDARGNLTRLDNALAGIPGRLERGQEQLENLRSQQAAALSMDESISQDEAEVSEEVGEGERPSVLEDLKKQAAEIPPDKKPGKEPERG